MKKFLTVVCTALLLSGFCFAEDDVASLEKQIQELQAKKIEALNNREKVLEAQRAEQEKKQKELAEKEKALKEAQDAVEKQKELAQQGLGNTDKNGKVTVQMEPVGRVVYVEAPGIVSGSSVESKKLSGTAAIKKSVSDTTVLPEYSDGALKAFVYKPQMLYQVHCQPYHTTMIQLEPGEVLLENPYISETQVWKLSRGTGITDGQLTQYFMIKPDKSDLDSTMIIITDRRVYQLQLKSFNDHYMPFVSWVYNNTGNEPWIVQDANKALARMNGQEEENEKPSLIEDIIAEQADVLSFNYEIKSMSKTSPTWMPIAVFDNGQFTYIILDKRCLNMEMPAVFENTKDVLNKNVKKNVIVINKLTKKLTLKLGSERVTVRKL